MIDLKNKTRETRTYQFDRSVSAGPVRPKVIEVIRGHHNPKTGEVTKRPTKITVGGVLTLRPRETATQLPDAILSNSTIAREIEYGVLAVKRHPKPRVVASVAPVEQPVSKKSKNKGRRRRG